MPVDEKELEQQVEKLIEEYEINPNTIRYYSNIERFFRAFTPKIVGTGTLLGTSGLAFASIIAGAVTGGLGFIPAVVAGSVAGVATAASAVATISLGVDAATVSRKRFKNLGVEDTKAVVEKMESEAYAYTQKLAELEQSGEKTIQLKDGNYYSARQLKKLIKGYEKEAYQGVKYLTAQAKKNTEQVENLRKAKNLTETQKKEQVRLWDELELIGECARNITSKRNDINPYKNVIIKALHSGCLIGRNDRENGEIRKHKIYGKLNLTEELYHNMYEKALLDVNPPKREELEVEKPKLTREEKKAEKVSNLKKQIRELQELNAELEEDNARKQARYERAVQRGWDKRAEANYFRNEKEKVEDAMAGFMMETNEENKVKEAESANNKRFIVKLIKELTRSTKLYENSVKRRINQRENIIDLETQKDALIDEVDEANAKIGKKDEKLKRAANIVTDLRKRATSAEQEAKESNTRAEAYKGEALAQTNARQAAEQATAREIGKRKAAETKVAALQGEVLAQTNARRSAENETAREISKRKASEVKVAALEGEVRAQANARRSADAAVESEKSKRSKVETELNNANNRINNLVLGAQTNIDTIIGLSVINDKLKNENEYWKTRAESAEDTVSAVYTASNATIEALDRSIATIQAELNSIHNQPAQNLEKANLARQNKSTARKIAEVWNHVKIAQNDDANKYAETTSQVIKALDIAVDKFNKAVEQGDIDTVKRIRVELQEVYDVQRRVDDEHTWPPYIKDTKKIIPGTPIPQSPQDENYYVK